MEFALKILNRRENVYGDLALSASPDGKCGVFREGSRFQKDPVWYGYAVL